MENLIVSVISNYYLAAVTRWITWSYLLSRIITLQLWQDGWLDRICYLKLLPCSCDKMDNLIISVISNCHLAAVTRWITWLNLLSRIITLQLWQGGQLYCICYPELLPCSCDKMDNLIVSFISNIDFIQFISLQNSYPIRSENSFFLNKYGARQGRIQKLGGGVNPPPWKS